MKRFPFIFIHCILTAYLFSGITPVAEVIEIIGEVKLNSAKYNQPPSLAIAGRSIYNGDILRSTLGSLIQIQFYELNSL